MRFDPEADGDAEWFHLRGYLAAPKLGRLLQAVRSPEVDVAVQQILLAPQR